MSPLPKCRKKNILSLFFKVSTHEPIPLNAFDMFFMDLSVSSSKILSSTANSWTKNIAGTDQKRRKNHQNDLAG